MKRLYFLVIFLVFVNGINAQLSGSYTIGSGGSYSDINAAVTSLLATGVSGPVVFSILPGTYIGQITLTDIPGSSITNTVTFQSFSQNAYDVTLSYSAASDLDNWVLFLKGCDNVQFKHVTVKPIGNDYAASILIGFSAQNISFESCRIIGKPNLGASNLDRYYNVASRLDPQQSQPDSNISFKSNHFIDGCNDIDLRGVSNANRSLVCVNVIDNIFDTWRNGFSFKFASNILVKGNIFRHQKSSPSSIGLLYSITGSILISSNVVIENQNLISGVNHTALFIKYCTPNPSEPGIIMNNMFSVSPSSTSYVGISFDYSNSFKVLNNSILFFGISEPSSTIISIPSNTTDITLNNNILSNQCGGKVLWHLSTSNLGSDYNDFYSSGSILCKRLTNDYSNLSQWQTATGLDQNSKSVFPGFVNNTDLHLSNAQLDSAATPLSWVYTDIDGDIRDSLYPDIGADEFRIVSKDLSMSLFGGTTEKSCCRGAIESLRVGLVNMGTDTLDFSEDTIYVHVYATGPNAMSFPVIMLSQGSLPPGDTLWQTITNSFNMQVSGLYQFWGYLSSAGDANAMNDTLFSTLITVQNLYQFPYFQDFESVPYGLLVGEWKTIYNNQAFSWKVANSNDPWFNSSLPLYPYADHTLQSSTGQFAFGNSDNSPQGVLLESPCIFVDSMKVKTLRFWYFMIGGNTGSLHLDIDTGCGYIHSYWHLSGAQQQSSFDAWKLAVIDLSSLTGLVRLRFRADNSQAPLYATLLYCYLDDIQLGTSLQNDAGVTEVLSPGAITLSGSNPLKVRIRNYGIAPLQQVQIAASVNSVNQPAINWSGQLPSQAYSDTVNTGTLMLTPGPALLKVWTQQPNNVPDSGTTNDTCYHTMYVCDNYLRGYYTLGDSTSDFLTFKDAIDALENCGVDSSVVILVKPGNYHEQIEITAIPGASAQNRVVFKSQSAVTGSCNLFFTSGSMADNYVIKLKSVSYLRFENLAFNSLGQQYSTVLSIEGVSTCNVFHQCRFNGPVATGSSPYKSLVNREGDYNENDSMNIFSQNEFNNGCFGILAGSYCGEMASNRWIIRGNHFTGQSYSAIRMTGFNAVEIDSNTFQQSGSNDIVYLDNCRDSVKICNNKLYHTETSYGIHLTNHKSRPQTPVLVANNFIHVSGAPVQALKIDAQHARICFNNVHMHNQGTTSGSCLAIPLADTLEVVNNIFMGSGPCYLLEIGSMSGVMARIDHNCYWGGSGIAHLGTQYYGGLSLWQNATGKDSNSRNINPNYITSTDLHVTQHLLYQAGIPVSGVERDIDGQLRHAQTPCIGADEFIPHIGDMGVSRLVYPLDTTQSGMISLCFGIRNYGSDTITSAILKWQLNGVNQNDIFWTGMLYPGNEDTVTANAVSLMNYGSQRIKAWTHQPNNQADPNAQNDTLKEVFYVCQGPLNGTYTIGQSTGNDFAGVVEAVKYMDKCGISGAVVFMISPGIYMGQVSIRPITGSSSQNTVRFLSALSDSTQVQIVHEDTGQTSGICLHIMGAKHLSFERVSILLNQAGLHGRVLKLENASDSNRIIGCVLQSNAGAGNVSVNTVIEADSVNGLWLEGNYVTGGLASIVLGGAGRGNRLVKNYLSSMRYYSVKAMKQDSLIVESNTIYNEQSQIYNESTGCIELSSLTGSGRITQNRLAGSMAIGISPSASQSEYLIANNFVHHYIPLSTQYSYTSGIDVHYENAGSSPSSVKVEVLYNTVVNYPICYAPILGTQSSMRINRINANVANNNLVNLRGGNALHVIDSNGIAQTTHNNYYSSSGQIALVNGQTLMSIASISQYLPGDSQSLSLQPLFQSLTDLHVSGGGLDGKGLPQATVLYDIDGDYRDTVYSDIGADEFSSHLWDLMALSPLKPEGSHIHYQSSVPLSLRFRNMSDSLISALQVGYMSAQQSYVAESWTGTLMPGDTGVHHFSIPLQLTAGTNTVKLVVKHPQDTYALNDTVLWDLTAHSALTPPWSDQFSTDKGWYEVHSLVKWERQSPVSPFTPSPNSGGEAMVLKKLIAAHPNHTSCLYTPFFNVSGLNNLRIGFYQNIQSLYAYRNIEISTDTGSTWTTLGFIGDSLGMNWYNKISNGQHCWAGKTSGWVYSDYLLSAYNNYSGLLQFRFVYWGSNMSFDNGRWAIDDFRIGYSDSLDAGLVRVLYPDHYLPSGTSFHPTIQVCNYGIQPLNNLLIGIQIQNQAVVSEPYPLILATGDTAIYTFSTAFTSPGSMCIKAFSMVSGDSNPLNDTSTSCLRRDLKIVGFEYPPNALPCNSVFNPRITIYNNGEDTVYQFTTNVDYNAVTLASQSWSGVLKPSDTLIVKITDSIAVLPGLRTLCAEILLADDYNPADNELCMGLSGTLDIVGEFSSNGFSVYPNPGNGMVWIRLYNAYPSRLLLYDITGQELFSTTLTEEISFLNLSHLPAGLYLGRIVSSSGEGGGFRFVKE